MDMLLDGAAIALDGAGSALFTPGSNVYNKPADAIGLQGQDSLLPLIEGEDPHTGHLPRLQNKWAFWASNPTAGLEEILSIEAGGPVAVKVPGDYASPPDAFDYWSRFWVELPEGSHPVPLGGSALTLGGSLVAGPGAVLGPEGITASYRQRLKAAARRYKPVQWVCWDFVFTVGGVEYRSMAHPRIDSNFVSEA